MWNFIEEQFAEFVSLTSHEWCSILYQNATFISNKVAEYSLPWIEPFILDAVFWWNKQWIRIQHMHQHQYASYSCYRDFTNIICSTCDMCMVVYNKIKGVETELTEPWISVYGYYPNNAKHKTHVFKYHEIVLEQPPSCSFTYSWGEYLFYSWIYATMNYEHESDVYNDNTDECEEYQTIDASVVQSIATQYERQTPVLNPNYIPVVITKWQGKYSCHVCSSPQNREKNPIVIVGDSSEVEFLFIEYHHPEMTSPLLLNIPKAMMMVGNEVLSSVFVLKLLEQIPSNFVFDNKYFLKLMDGDINVFELHANQYIILGRDKYTIVTGV